MGLATVAISLGVLLGRFDVPEASAAAPRLQQFSGTISSVDRLSNAVVVDRRLWGVSVGQPTEIRLGEGTVLASEDGQPLRLHQLEAGQRVTVSFYDDSGSTIARSITVKSPMTTNFPASPVGPPYPTDIPAPTPEATPSREQPSPPSPER